MIIFLRILFFSIFVAMVYITVNAGLHENLWVAVERLSGDHWAAATLWDAYCGFFTFYVWVAYKEGWVGRVVWFVAIMCLGNIAMSVYALIQLFRVPITGGFQDVVLKKA